MRYHGALNVGLRCKYFELCAFSGLFHCYWAVKVGTKLADALELNSKAHAFSD